VKPAFSDFERTAAAHEIRGALSVLSLYIELLRVSADAGEVPDPSWIDTMSSSVRRAATITTRLAMRTPPPSRDVAGRR
jgi:signal transduction histidine kinase